MVKIVKEEEVKGEDKLKRDVIKIVKEEEDGNKEEIVRIKTKNTKNNFVFTMMNGETN